MVLTHFYYAYWHYLHFVYKSQATQTQMAPPQLEFSTIFASVTNKFVWGILN